MGKPTGFLEYERDENKSLTPDSRIKNFNEFHHIHSRRIRRKQAARCMNCGVPFCQSGMVLNGMITGCPLYNLIPEWNDDVYRDNFKNALERLLKTNNFPEFTGRVCPAPCEAACVNNLNGESVTIRDNELYIIETAFDKGLIKPVPPKIRSGKKVAVIGSGPAGLAVADSLNKRGHTVSVYEKSDRTGGLLMYGIPNMKLNKSVIERRINIMKQEGVEFTTSYDAAIKSNVSEILKKYDAVILCCGANQPRDINVAGRNCKGVYFAVDFLSLNTKSLLDSEFKDKNYPNPKNKNVVILGGGDTGNDCVGTCIRHGCKSVVQLEITDKPPVKRPENNPWPEWPKTLKTDYGQEEAISVFGKDPRIFNTTVKEIESTDGKISAVKTIKTEFKNGKLFKLPGTEKTIPTDMLIIAAGFTGTKKEVPEAFGVELTERNTVKTYDYGFSTNIPKIFTAGDMKNGQSLVASAIRDGRECARFVDAYLMEYTNMI